MANPFYARYVPSTVPSTTSIQDVVARSQIDSAGKKRKRQYDRTRDAKTTKYIKVDGEASSASPCNGKVPHRTTKSLPNVQDEELRNARKDRPDKRSTARKVKHSPGRKDSSKFLNGEISQEHEIKDDQMVNSSDPTGVATNDKGITKENQKGQIVHRERAIEGPTTLPASDQSRKRGQHIGIENQIRKRKRRKEQVREHTHDAKNDLQNTNVAAESVTDSKYAKVMSKYKKSQELQLDGRSKDQDSDNLNATHTEEAEVNDLVPIPIPDPDVSVGARPSYETLPRWLSRPSTTSSAETTPFGSFELSERVRGILSSNGYKEALAVQSAVLPLMLPVPSQHPGDLCISAATGSGKTLSYMIPLVENFKNGHVGSLRAVIIVPTRELVEQARDVAAMCVASTDLKVGVAVGSQSLDSERETLINKEAIHDPEAHKSMRARWQKWFDGEEDDSDSDDGDGDVGLSDEYFDVAPDWIFEYTSQVDILICTPGRLVEHIKSTRGFDLSKLEWLIIDEADRLLDQSFQEWTDVITTAMAKRETLDSQRPGLFNSHLPMRAKIDDITKVRKVVLSATMTRDLEKLQMLALRNPRLVVVGNAAGEDEHVKGHDLTRNAEGYITLPSTLDEHAVSVGDGSDKPLYLVQLLMNLLGNKLFSRQPYVEDLNEDEDLFSNDESDSSQDQMQSYFDDDEESELAVNSSSEDNTQENHGVDCRRPSPGSTMVVDSSGANALIFVSSNESALRLQTLLTHMHPSLSRHLAALTKSTSKKATQAIISRFNAASQSAPVQTPRRASLCILIATDRASRGLDLPSLSNVINYDIPHSVNSYVHRIGRTARAGRHGHAWTLLQDREAAWFWNVVGRGVGKDGEEIDAKIDRGSASIARERLKDVGRDGRREAYLAALKTLKEDVKGSRH